MSTMPALLAAGVDHALGRPVPSSFVHVAMRRSAEPRRYRLGDAAPVSSAPPPDFAARRRVVVVDADRRVRRDLAGLVDLGDGCSCVGVAGDADTALELIRREDPDVVVVDPRLPDLDAGLALVSRVRNESGARIVVIGNDPALAARARTVGADDFVTKDAQLSPRIEAIVRSDDRRERPAAATADRSDDRRDG
jgi:CheY-like chemotaxis protein